MSTLTSDMAAALPEILLAIGGMVILMLGVFRGGAGPASEAAAARLAHYAAILLLAVVGALTAFSDDAGSAFGGLYISDGFSAFAKVLILFGAAALLWLGMEYLERHRIFKFEYPVLVVFASLGMCMMVSADDLIALYMGIELQSLSLYVIAAFHRDNLRSTEAGLKYFVLGALSSGLLLYGASLIYGYSGSPSSRRSGRRWRRRSGPWGC